MVENLENCLFCLRRQQGQGEYFVGVKKGDSPRSGKTISLAGCIRWRHFNLFVELMSLLLPEYLTQILFRQEEGGGGGDLAGQFVSCVSMPKSSDKEAKFVLQVWVGSQVLEQSSVFFRCKPPSEVVDLQ